MDFRDGTFHEPVVGVQYNHYGSVSAPVEWRPVDDVDPVELGVRPTRRVPGEPDVPPYVPRDCDAVLREELAHGGLVLVLGEPYVGKSYTAWNALRSLAARRYAVYAPDPREELRRLPAAVRGRTGGHVVWLDDVTEHLGSGGLERRLLGRLTSLGVVVLGTMAPEEYYRRRFGTTPGESALATARTVTVDREWSEGELQRLAHTEDPRAYPAYMWSGKEGAASYFAIGHVLFDEWQRDGTRTDHPRGQTLVRAAVDLARCGVTEAVPAGLLREVEACYAEPTENGPERFEDALAWATTPKSGGSSLLVAGERNGTWRAYGALVAEALRSGGLPPVPDDVWWVLLDDARVDRAAVMDAAQAAMRHRVEAGDVAVMRRFAVLSEGEKQQEWYRMAVGHGDRLAALRLAEILLERDDEQAAIPYLERAAEGGLAEAALQLSEIYQRRAWEWARVAVKIDHGRLEGPPAPDTV
ncbi:hypothetical protein ACWDGI_33575 [Streptomyces sp. NPDC001220]